MPFSAYISRLGFQFTAATLLLTTAGLAASPTLSAAGRPARPDAFCPPSPRPPDLTPGLPADPPAEAAAVPTIQLALLLDTSNSMDNLIGQAKARLWEVVSRLARARQHGRAPKLEVAVYEYGNNGIPSEAGYVRQVVPLTTDLDRISDRLFTLRTNGGDEYCGWAINDCVRDLAWQPALNPSGEHRPHAYRLIVIAGNEPFRQGAIDARLAIKAARAKGIRVNTIFCGPGGEGDATGWREAAAIGGGRYCSINLDAPVIDDPTPYDDELLRLNAELNKTYLPFGERGRESSDLQVAQDAANEAAGAGAARAAAKASTVYVNAHWDLVDAVEQKKVAPESLEAAQLPDAMQALAPDARLNFVHAMRDQRTQIQARISELDRQRRIHLDQLHTGVGGQRLDDAILTALREQILEAGFTFE